MKQILIADDDPSQIVLIQVAVNRAKLPTHSFRFFSDGFALKRFLEKGVNSEVKPDLLLLDLNMPAMDGFEVIAWVRSDPVFAKLPIAVISSSTEFDDIRRAQALGCNKFLQKPSTLAELTELLKTLCNSPVLKSTTCRLEVEILVQDTTNGMYFVGLDEWSAQAGKALNFERIEHANGFINSKKLKAANLVTRVAKNNAASA